MTPSPTVWAGGAPPSAAGLWLHPPPPIMAPTSTTSKKSTAAASSTTAASLQATAARRSGPAFEKLLVGPLMVFMEMISGGHYFEVLRLGKQMVVVDQKQPQQQALPKHRHHHHHHPGAAAASAWTRSGMPARLNAGTATAALSAPANSSTMAGAATTAAAEPSYWHLHRTLVRESGLVGAFYRGFWPWGLLQCGKGIPVLFVQHEAAHQLQARGIASPSKAEKVGGVLGGMAQALFVTPMQKIKVTVVASQDLNALGPLGALRTVVQQHGVAALYDGVVPMMMRRSLDWGIRFSVSSEAKNYWLARKQEQHGGVPVALEFYELVACGLVGGAASSSTHPLDNVITNSQKPLPVGAKRDLLTVIRRMYRENGGYRAFTRGWAIKVVDNAYHMAWMYGVGTLLYDWMHATLRQEEH